MLVAETELRDGDGILIIGAEGSPGRHIASALMRMGQRILLQLSKAQSAEAMKPLNTEIIRTETEIPMLEEIIAAKREFTSLIIAPSLHLSTGQNLSSQHLMHLQKLLADFDAKMPEVQKWVLLSQYQSDTSSEQLFQCSKNTHWLICPLVIGFRDQNLLDEMMLPLKEQRSLKFQAAGTFEDLNMVFASDVAAVTIAALRKGPGPQQIIRITENVTGLPSLILQFQKSMNEKTGASWSDFLSKALFSKNQPIGSRISISESKTLAATLQFKNMPRAEEIFPNSPTKPERFFKQIKEFWKRDPKLELHFPPSRAP